MARGMLTDTAKNMALELLNIDLDTKGLRLMPYIQYTMMNSQKLDPNKVSSEERAILAEWRDKGLMEGGAGGLSITKEFWDGINQILWITYIDC